MLCHGVEHPKRACSFTRHILTSDTHHIAGAKVGDAALNFARYDRQHSAKTGGAQKQQQQQTHRTVANTISRPMPRLGTKIRRPLGQRPIDHMTNDQRIDNGNGMRLVLH